MKRWIVSFAVVVGLASGCATRPSEIPESYVSPTLYDGRSCAELIDERKRVEAALTEATIAQRRRWKGDIAAVALIGLPLASMRSGDRWEQISTLKGARKTLLGLEAANECVEAG